MTQAQLNALKTTLDAMPAHPAPVTVPLAEQSPFTDEMYGKALDAVRRQGRYTAQAIKEATGLKATKDVDAIRDAMVRRGQLIERGTLGAESQRQSLLAQAARGTDEYQRHALVTDGHRRAADVGYQRGIEGQRLDAQPGRVDDLEDQFAGIDHLAGERRSALPCSAAAARQ